MILSCLVEKAKVCELQSDMLVRGALQISIDLSMPRRIDQRARPSAKVLRSFNVKEISKSALENMLLNK